MKRWIEAFGFTLLILLISGLVNAENNLNISPQFKNPQKVHIEGLPEGARGSLLSVEEPFISRDGKFLFFNSGKEENNKDLHYAKWAKRRWLYKGQVGPNINTSKEVEGNPTMDEKYNFYYIDSGIEAMARAAYFSPKSGELNSVRELEGIPKRKIQLIRQRLYGNMGVEVSADGSYLFFSRATWGLNGLKLGTFIDSEILFLKRQNGTYVYDETEADRIMKNINTPDLEYAASISADGLELYFTRLAIEDLKNGNIRSKIMISRRNEISFPFEKPVIIEAIGTSDFVEGPAISADGNDLYYHKREGDKFRLFKVTR